LLLIEPADITIYDYNIFRGFCLRRDEYKCKICGRTKEELMKEGLTIDVHHILLRSKRPESTLDVNNGITLH